MIRVLAQSLSGSEQIIRGYVRDKEGVPFSSEEQARAHLGRIGWTNIRFQIEERTGPNGELEILWDDQSITHGSEIIKYVRGKPPASKISKSLLR